MCSGVFSTSSSTDNAIKSVVWCRYISMPCVLVVRRSIDVFVMSKCEENREGQPKNVSCSRYVDADPQTAITNNECNVRSENALSLSLQPFFRRLRPSRNNASNTPSRAERIGMILI